MTETNSPALFSADQNKACYELLATAAINRQHGNDGQERGRLSILPYDQKNPFHDLNNQYFPSIIDPDYKAVKFLAEFAVGGFKVPTQNNTPIINGLIDQADETGLTRVVAESVLNGNKSKNTLVVTGHGDLFEPIIAVLPGLLGAARRARSSADRDLFLQQLLSQTDLFVSRYLTTYSVSLAGDASKTPVLGLLRNGCGVYTTFPNTENGRALGVDEGLIKLHNAQLVTRMAQKATGNIVIVAGSATEEKTDNTGAKIIKEPNIGTERLVIGRRVIAVAYASGNQAESPSILGCKLIKQETMPGHVEDANHVSKAMHWMAKVRTAAGYETRVAPVNSIN